MHQRLAGALLVAAVILLSLGQASALAADGQMPAIVVTKGVSVSHDGPFETSVVVPSGSVVWYRVVVKNDGPTEMGGITLADSATGRSLPPGCVGIPSPLVPGATYTCLYRLSVAPGVVANLATASFAGRSSSAIAVVSGTGVGTVADQPAGLASSANEGRAGGSSSPGAFVPTTTLVPAGRPVTWAAELGSGFAGMTIGVYLSEKTDDGSWTPFARVTSRTADDEGIVRYTRSEDSAQWISVRFAFDATTTNAVQARWQ